MSDKETAMKLCDEKISTMRFKNSDAWFDFREKVEEIVDYLLENGVMCPPCKVGDTVYYINRFYHIELKKDTIYEAKVVRIVTTSLGTSLVIQMRGEWGCIEQSNIDCIETPNVKDFDKTVFLTKEEAEAKLKELGK